ncbi:hypothetical protein PYK79_45100 [Streptomyces sp. ID05-04B]|uniref:hypothetical protein n=1 Tax=unclassified Streptomyces TaxID=2593676 RepID=UPI000D1A75BB|nr:MULTISPECIES: hypothetical protein [unclassified Streptomyces]AVV46431.1 hypothetical protein C6376_38840 [Streptomyces sp. P3]AVV46490.1 hypothetical protein C6376_39140 [Streptomyces sp. P3]MDX5569026.1 hypothetical protein [Streptomyces sp. ID05-04B]
MHRPVVHRRDPRLEIITEAIERLIPGATPAFLLVTVVEQLPGTGETRVNTWSGKPEGLATKVFTALYGRPRTEEPRSPLVQADDARRAGDLDGETRALMAAGIGLESAPWQPARPGDLVHLHYPASGDVPQFGETYIVGDAGDGLLSLQLLAHTLPATEDVDGMTGCFASDASDQPLYELWFEAGPHLLTIVRDGRPVHVGGAR